ncbi:MAG: hypothetical protein WDO13_13760 [Verrucomicrobiota bacterium]
MCTEGARIFSAVEHQLTFDGRVIQAGVRRFWDFRDPWVIDYLSRAVIDFLRREGFGYLKVDYNDTIGVWLRRCPGSRRGSAPASRRRVRILRQDPPRAPRPRDRKLCLGRPPARAAHGRRHRDEQFLRRAPDLRNSLDRGESSAPHPAGEIADLGRAACCGRRPPTLLHAECDVPRPDVPFWRNPRSHPRAVAAGRARDGALPRGLAILREGSSRRFGRWEQSIRRLRDYQAVRRIAADGTRALVVWHTFEAPGPQTFHHPAAAGRLAYRGRLHDSCKARVEAESLTLFDVAPYSGGRRAPGARLSARPVPALVIAASPPRS